MSEENKDQSNKQPERKGGRGKITPNDGVASRFSKDRQPTHEQRAKASRTWSTKKLLKDLLALKPKGKIGSGKLDYTKAAAEYFGIKEESVTIKMIMDYRQIEKAVLKADTGAYIALNDRAYGKPPQQMQITGEDGKKLNVDLSVENLPNLSTEDLINFIAKRANK